MRERGARLSSIRKVYPGHAPDLRGTQLEAKGPALWLRGLRHALSLTAQSVPTVEALRGVDLQLRPGEVLGLIGRNGSGKTTLVRILAGLLSPTAGEGQVAGAPLDRPSAVRRRVAHLATNAWMALEWPLTVEENVRYFGVLCGLGGREAAGRGEQALRAVGLFADRRKYPGQLSNGMRQRAALARILLSSAPVVLLDEPTVGLDPESAQTVLALIRGQLRAAGRAVLLTGHLTAELEAASDRVTVLDRGRVVGEGSPADLRARLRDWAVVEVEIEEEDGPLPPPTEGVRPLQASFRGGPVPCVRHRLLVRGDDAPASALDWLMTEGRAPGRIVGLGESAPTLEDAVRDLLEREALPHGAAD